jgi:uncharacterized protein YkwD
MVPRFVRFHKHAFIVFVAFFWLFWSAPSGAAPTRGERTLLDAINSVRVANGLAGLRIDPRLERAARSHSRDMLRRGYFSHGAFTRRMVAFGVRGPSVGENLAWGAGAQARASTIVATWLASPEHRSNLLRRGFRRIGIGRIRGTFGGHPGAAVITADFAGR